MDMNKAMIDFNRSLPNFPAAPEELVTRVHYMELALAGAALPSGVQLFKTAPATFAEWSLNQPGRVPYPFVLQSIGLEWFGAAADWFIFAQECYFTPVIGTKTYNRVPASLLPGGGGITGLTEDMSAAADTNYANNGVPASGAKMDFLPIGIGSDVDFYVELTSRATAVAASRIRLSLHGVERRPMQ